MPAKVFSTKNPSIRTDLAVEARQFLTQQGHAVPGVTFKEDTGEYAHVSSVEITTPEGAQAMGKPPGNYITIESQYLRQTNKVIQEEISQILARELEKLFNLAENAAVLVIGLGNWHATPDALGPRVIDKLMVTRHIAQYAPEELGEGLRIVSALAPGVLGITGIETGEIVRGIVQNVKPDLVIAIDSLAARNVDRVCTTIQLADNGINPGSGVGNKRLALNEETMGVPVIAIGVPTVVHATNIAYDVIETLLGQVKGEMDLGIMGKLGAADKRQTIQAVLGPGIGDLHVTPKEIDFLILNLSQILSGALNVALHPAVKEKDVFRYLQ
ncbi:MAG: GPR endopeptidase [Firmicutes bacterium]|nr:GPR endopeptidase [Bacillota bacterium]